MPQESATCVEGQILRRVRSPTYCSSVGVEEVAKHVLAMIETRVSALQRGPMLEPVPYVFVRFRARHLDFHVRAMITARSMGVSRSKSIKQRVSSVESIFVSGYSSSKYTSSLFAVKGPW